SRAGPPFHDMVPIARSLVEAAPDRTLWGTDWPHPVLSGPMPDDGQLVDLLAELVPDAEPRQKVLVANPARLYGFRRPDRSGPGSPAAAPPASRPRATARCRR